jgi:hypothetical protein
MAIEINANPCRLDMDWRWRERGIELGCIFSINPDAHSTEEIDNIRWACSWRARAPCQGIASSTRRRFVNPCPSGKTEDKPTPEETAAARGSSALD